MPIDVGMRLREVRRLRGLSQRELAKRVGVTNSTISLIEQNRVSPSVSSLEKVLNGIPMSMVDFFSVGANDKSPSKTFYRLEDMPDLGGKGGKGGKGIEYLLVGAGFGAERDMSVVRGRFQPGVDTGSITGPRKGQQGGVVVEGRVEVTVGGETKVLGPGDGYYFDSSVPHRFRVIGSEEVVIVNAITPPTF